MRTIGKLTRAELALIEKRGMSPKEAVCAIIAEAKSRYPRAESVHIVKASSHDGFDIVAL